MTKVICHYSLTKAEEDVYFKTTKKNSGKFFHTDTPLFFLYGAVLI